MEVDDAGGHAQRWRGQQQVERRVVVQVVEQQAQQPLGAVSRVGIHEPSARVFPAPLQEVRHGVSCRKAMLQCRVNATSRQR
jgi:hypothetical protein